jgi:hypothetical protein
VRAFLLVLRLVPSPLLALLVAASASASAPAQSATFLVPDRFQAAPGGNVRIHVETGAASALAPAPWPSGAIEQFFVRTAGTQRNAPDAAPARPEDGFVAVDLGDPDAAMIGLDRRPWVESVPVAALRELGETDVAASGDTVRVRRLDSAKLLVRSVRETPSGEPERLPGSAMAASRAGQRTEIRVMVDPTVMSLGSDLPMRVSWSDAKEVDATILARHVPSGTSVSVRAPKGSGFVRIDRSGRWQLEVRRARRLVDDPAADWEIECATVVFSVPEPRKAPGRGR